MPEYCPEQLEDEALAWLVRSTSGAMTAEQAVQLAAWLQQSPAHQEAFDATRQLWEGLGELRGRPMLNDAGPAIGKPANIPRRPVRKSCLMGLATAASVLLCTFLLYANPDFWQAWQAQYRTQVGGQQTVVLADGSTVYLNTATALDSSFSNSQRWMTLIAGEAEFIVSKDHVRPFVVDVDGYEITALGTDFVVKKQDQGFTVTLLESAVRVSLPQSPGFTPIVVKAGQLWSATTAALTKINPDNAAAWRKHRLIFESEPLANVVAEINRYRNGYVLLGNPYLSGLKVSGVFNIDHLDALLNVINKTLPVKSVVLTGRYVVLY
ncbi:MAG: FecR family protein [Methylovulum sp.]|nr:FecR family protein [Methylovulum sp.]